MPLLSLYRTCLYGQVLARINYAGQHHFFNHSILPPFLLQYLLQPFCAIMSLPNDAGMSLSLSTCLPTHAFTPEFPPTNVRHHLPSISVLHPSLEQTSGRGNEVDAMEMGIPSQIPVTLPPPSFIPEQHRSHSSIHASCLSCLSSLHPHLHLIIFPPFDSTSTTIP